MTEDSFGRWLHRRRRALDLTQDELAQQVICSVSAIRKLEADERRPSKPIAARLALALHLAPEDHAAFITFARTEPHLNMSRPLPTLPELSPLREAPRRLAILPTPLTRLIGRDQDVAAASNMLLHGDTRLFTLIGPPGIGKTRLSLAIAHNLQSSFRDGASFVALAPISDPALVPATIAQALGIKETAGQPLLDQLVAALQGQQRLLLLDNFEQVLAAAALVAALLEACPGVKALITSRAALHVRGERLYPVPALLLPNLARLPTPSALAHTPAVVLFVERAQAMLPTFQLTGQNAAAVAAICVRLDGLPLAIELAATRITLLPPVALLTRLEQRLAFLTDGARDLPPRHQTLRAAIAWSYDLLDARAQTLFRRLGVFVGGWTLAAAAAVLGFEFKVLSEDANQLKTLEGLATLVDTSLLRRAEGEDGESRFTMLETIREYALERLELSGEADVLRRRHADYYVALAEAAESHISGPDDVGWLNRLELEHNNLRAALTWSQNVGDATLGLHLAGALWTFWRVRSYWSEGRDWLVGLLALTHHGDASLRAKALHGAGVLANCQGDYVRADILCKQSLALFSELGDKQGIAWALNELGYVTQEQSDLKQAAACWQESLTLFRELGDKRGVAEALDNLGRMARDQSDYTRATTLFQESLTLFRELGDKRGVALALKSAGIMAWLQGNYATARSVFEESLPLFRELGDIWGAALSLNHLGLVEREQGGYTAARSLHEESLALRRALGDKTGIAYSLHDLGIVVHRQGDNAQARMLLDESLDMFRGLRDTGGIALALNTLGHVTQSQGEARRAVSLLFESLTLYQALEFKPGIAGTLAGLAKVAGSTGQPEWAARLFGAAAALREAAGIPLAAVDRADYDRDLATARAQFDDATFTAAWAEGLAMTREQAIAAAQHLIALEQPPSHSPPRMT